MNLQSAPILGHIQRNFFGMKQRSCSANGADSQLVQKPVRNNYDIVVGGVTLNGVIPVGYMAKHISKRPEFLKAAQVIDVYSVSSCVSDEFADYIDYWKHNGYWLFDSPEAILDLAKKIGTSLEGTSLFYYEAYEMEFDDRNWKPWSPDPSIPTNVVPPLRKNLEGFDVVTFLAGNAPECSPLSCNSLSEGLQTNEHCLFASFEAARTSLDNGRFMKCEPGPYRIIAVYSVNW